MLFRRNKNQSQLTVNRLVTKKSRKTRFILWSFVVVVVGLIGWIATTGLIALNNISAKNTDDKPSFFKFGQNIDPSLITEGQSRINILAIGVDKAASLTDTIQIISVDPINKKMAMLSIPRDLYVTAPGLGKVKVNGVYNQSSKYCPRKTTTCDPDIDYGAEALKEVLENSLAINIHYFARVNFDGLRKIVDNVGGIQIYVDRPLNDPRFPNSTNTGYEPLYIPAGLQTFYGDKALKYARSRQSTSDFDRSRRQQQVIVALKEKLSASNTISSPKKLTDLITIVGRNLRTDISIEDMSKLYAIIKDVPKEGITNFVLDSSANSPLRSGTSINGSYILYPKKGIDDFSGVKEYVQTIFPDPYVIKESAKIYLINATGNSANTKLLEELLEARGYVIVGSEASTTTEQNSQLSSNKDYPYTVALLEKRFGINNLTRKPNTPVEADLVLIIGSSYQGL